MKQILILFLFIPLLSNAQIEISYNSNNNTVSVDYTGCDICLLGTQSAVNTCECREDCTDAEPTEEDWKNYESCIERCREDYGDDPNYEDYCLDECEARLYSSERVCLEDCGPPSSAIRTIVGFSYRLVAAWDVIPFDPRFNESEWKEFQSDLIESNQIVIPNWNPPSPWPEVHSGNNTCYGVGIRIFYEDPDGTVGFCDFTEWQCNIIG